MAYSTEQYRVTYTNGRGKARERRFPATPAGLRRALGLRKRLPFNADSNVALVTPAQLEGLKVRR